MNSIDEKSTMQMAGLYYSFSNDLYIYKAIVLVFKVSIRKINRNQRSDKTSYPTFLILTAIPFE